MTARKAGIRLALVNASGAAGESLDSKIAGRFVSLTLKEAREDDADQLDLVLSNSDGLLAVPEPDVTLSLALGWESGDGVPVGLVDKGRYIVDEVAQQGPPDQVTIRARSADMTGELRQRRTQSWKDTTLGSVLGRIADRHGRFARVEAGLAELPIRVIEQEGKSDMQFVRDLGRRYDAIATWKNDMLLFLPIGISASVGGAPLSSLVLAKRDGWSWKFSQAERDNYDGAQAQWQDQDGARRRTVKVGGTEKVRKLKRVYASEAEAKQAASAATSKAARSPYSFTYDLAIADTGLQPDVPVSLQGWGAKIDGISWLVKSVSTTMDANGLKQSIELESA